MSPPGSRSSFVGPLVSAGLVALALAASVTSAACTSLKDGSPGSPDDGGASGSGGGGASGSSGGSSGTSGSSGSGTDDAGHAGGDASDASDASDAGDASGPTGLDPAVPIPSLATQPCDPPGNSTVCPGVAACRMATPTSGRCDDCNAPGTCSKLVGQTCVGASDCDINLNCFHGMCVLVCPFMFPQTCGGARACVDVGYTGGYGLCEPTF